MNRLFRKRPALTAALCGVSACLLSAASGAQTQIFTSESAYLSAAGNVSFESFEGLTPRVRVSDPIAVPAFTLTPAPGLLGVQNGANSPEPGYGASAIDGSHYLLMYRPNISAGTLQFDFTRPTNTFGFYITDLGETSGVLSFHTNAGASVNETTLAQYPPLPGNGNVQFYGFTQDTPFTSLSLTSTGLDDSYGLDKVYTRSAAAVPAPGGNAVIGVMVTVGAGFLRKRRR